MSANIDLKYLLYGNDSHYVNYVLEDQVCRYLYDIRYEAQLRCSQDQEQIEMMRTLDPELIYLSFREFLKQLSGDLNELQRYVERVIGIQMRRNVYIEETCVVCLEKPPNIVLDCKHQPLCEDCYDGLIQQICPLCRSPIIISFTRPKKI